MTSSQWKKLRLGKKWVEICGFLAMANSESWVELKEEMVCVCVTHQNPQQQV